jgi:hypothetical protein
LTALPSTAVSTCGTASPAIERARGTLANNAPMIPSIRSGSKVAVAFDIAPSDVRATPSVFRTLSSVLACCNARSVRVAGLNIAIRMSITDWS